MSCHSCALAEAVEADGADHHGREGDRAGHPLEARQPAERPPHADHAVAGLEDRQAGEEVEVDGEGLAALGPGLDAVDALQRQREDRVADDRRREHRRVLAPARGELDPDEHEQADRGGPAAELLRVRASALRQQAAERAPGAEGLEDVAEQDRGEHQPDPEDDHHERRRPVVERALRPQIAGEDRHDQQADADRAAQRLHRRARDHAPAGQRAPRVVLQPRLGPQHGEREERDHQHRRRRPEQQPLRDRELLALDEPVRVGD